MRKSWDLTESVLSVFCFYCMFVFLARHNVSGTSQHPEDCPRLHLQFYYWAKTVTETSLGAVFLTQLPQSQIIQKFDVFVIPTFNL